MEQAIHRYKGVKIHSISIGVEARANTYGKIYTLQLLEQPNTWGDLHIIIGLFRFYIVSCPYMR